MSDQLHLRRLLETDRRWATYALADLQPAFIRHCQWQLGECAEGPGVALLFHALQPPPLFTMGPVEAVAAALAQLPLPQSIYLTVREEHFSLLLPQFDFCHGLHPMWRMALATASPNALPAAPGLTRLTQLDAGAIRALYTHGGPFTPDAFDPYQLEEGIFFGIRDQGDQLLAVGGTHIIDRGEGLAAIGNMYTRPDCRGRGFAGLILAAIVHTLRSEGIATIILNVDQQNPIARRLYEKHGFQVHLPYIEGVGTRKL
jgi:ribosomal protein S18 acetylase RimI-like enzyme